MADFGTDAVASTVHTLSRRTMVKGAAWAAPAVLLASAAPAMALSPIPVSGKLYESSFTASARHVVASSARAEDCMWDGQTTASLTFTFTITYFGPISHFTFAGSTIVGDGSLWTTSVSEDGHVLTLVRTSATDVRCEDGMQTQIDVTLPEGTPAMTPNSIRLDCVGKDAAGDVVITGIVEAAGGSDNGLNRGDPLIGTTH